MSEPIKKPSKQSICSITVFKQRFYKSLFCDSSSTDFHRIVFLLRRIESCIFMKTKIWGYLIRTITRIQDYINLKKVLDHKHCSNYFSFHDAKLTKILINTCLFYFAKLINCTKYFNCQSCWLNYIMHIMTAECPL